MKKFELLVAALGTFVALPALAEEASQNPLTANVSLVNNYLLRGISQTGGKPAVQGGFDYANPNGFYIGVWGSNISILSDAGVAANSSLELDTYLGIKNSFATDFNYDVGYLRYNLPGAYTPGATSGNTTEIYGSLGYQWLAVKYSYSLGNTFGIAEARGSNYLDLSANYPIPDTGFAMGAHYGRQTFKGSVADIDKANGLDPSYADYKVNASYNMNGYVFGVAYSKTNAKNGGFYTNLQGENLGKGAYILSLSRTF
jgi:uncharacterized protein (TIGR02001 family)